MIVAVALIDSKMLFIKEGYDALSPLLGVKTNDWIVTEARKLDVTAQLNDNLRVLVSLADSDDSFEYNYVGNFLVLKKLR